MRGELAIADRLSASDSSPSEMGAALVPPGNLLGHHVSVLVQAGMVWRFRPKGDRRRACVSLDPAVDPRDPVPVGTDLAFDRAVAEIDQRIGLLAGAVRQR